MKPGELRSRAIAEEVSRYPEAGDVVAEAVARHEARARAKTPEGYLVLTPDPLWAKHRVEWWLRDREGFLTHTGGEHLSEEYLDMYIAEHLENEPDDPGVDWPEYFKTYPPGKGPLSDIGPRKIGGQGGTAMARSTTCEVERTKHDKATWITIHVTEALGLDRKQKQRLRCVDCHGRVKPVRVGPAGKPCAHFEHFRRHRGCSRGDCFDGTHTPHPNALE